jgi:hypothetical protein
MTTGRDVGLTGALAGAWAALWYSHRGKIGLALTLVVACTALWYSHRYAYRQGAERYGQALDEVLWADEREAVCTRFYYEVLALRVLARHPDAAKPSDVQMHYFSAKSRADQMEQKIIPRLRAAGDEAEADRQEALVREARALLAKLPRPAGIPEGGP